ncbi:hypothetical protein NLI96_g9922 [Meripilus lineatus]|uniref:Serine protease n=1 Tax=Meripilus lineatus TaxID=2056292 RepID=A0AAD5UUQ0_9APHY|nr:hypothetical protein NLI96_g9922 [Physisporinus lineatus]
MGGGPSASYGELISQGVGETPSITTYASPLDQPTNTEAHYPCVMEARYYYYGIPSTPPLLVRSSINAIWEQQYGGEAAPKIKEIRPFESHAIQDIWEGNLALRIIAILDSNGVQWTSIDVVRFGWRNESRSFPTLWIGVKEPVGFDSMGDEEKQTYIRRLGSVIPDCLNALREADIFDVEVEFRHSIVTPNMQLKAPTSSDVCPDAQVPIVTAVGLPIASVQYGGRGSGGFFFTADEKRERLLLLTARHVFFGPQDDNNVYDNRDTPYSGHDVVLIGDDTAFQSYLANLKKGKKTEEALFNDYLNNLGPPEFDTQEQTRLINASLDRRIALTRICWQLETSWNTMSKRTLGHVIFAPPDNTKPAIYDSITMDHDAPYPDDWAVIEIRSSKINNFTGNVLDLGTKFSHLNRHSMFGQLSPAAAQDRLLQLRDYISKEDIGLPMKVLKRGLGTNLTVGQSTPINVPSYFRLSYDSEKSVCLKGWLIAPLTQVQHEPFSSRGDSGSVVVDSDGRLAGMLIGGSSSTEESPQFISYAIPITHLRKRMKASGFKRPDFDPVLSGI